MSSTIEKSVNEENLLQNLALVAFLSGLAALINEVVWGYRFSSQLGSSLLAHSCVLGVFMVFLALGALAGGKFSTFQPVRRLMLVQLALAFAGPLATALTGTLPRYLTIVGMSSSTLFRLGNDVLVVTLCLAIPCTLMGMTLPLLFACLKKTVVQESAPQIYGVNTIGGALGALLSGFVLLRAVGVIHSSLLAGVFNLLAASLVYSSLSLTTTLTDNDRAEEVESSFVAESACYIAAFVSGAYVLSLELMWLRLTNYVLGERAAAASLLIGIVLLALGFSAWVTPRFVKGRESSLLLGYLLTASAIVGTLSGILGWWFLVPWTEKLTGPLSRCFCTALLLLPTFLIVGLVTPASICLLRGLREQAGQVTGLLFFGNALAAMVGSLFTGYCLVPAVGSPKAFLLSALFPLAAAIYLLPKEKRAVLGLVVLVGFLIPNPPVYNPVEDGGEILAHREDAFGVNTIVKSTSGPVLLYNNRSLLVNPIGLRSTTLAQHLQGHLPMLLASESKSALNIGTGYGITAAALAMYEKSSVETVELLPFVVEYAHLFSPHNLNYFEKENVKTILGDGRRWLAESKKLYDVISVGVDSPYLPGSGTLYSVEFFQLARKKLKAGGVFSILVWGPDRALLIKSIRSVFPSLVLVPVYRESLIVIAFQANKLPERARLDRMSDETEKVFHALGIKDTKFYFTSLLRVGDDLAKEHLKKEELLDDTLPTDIHPFLEYGLSKEGSDLFSLGQRWKWRE